MEMVYDNPKFNVPYAQITLNYDSGDQGQYNYKNVVFKNNIASESQSRLTNSYTIL